MADITRIKIPNGNSYTIKDVTALSRSGGTMVGPLVVNNLLSASSLQVASIIAGTITNASTASLASSARVASTATMDSAGHIINNYYSPKENTVTDVSYDSLSHKLKKVINGSTSDIFTLSLATSSTEGLMSVSDKTKLDGILVGAEANVNADWDAVSGDAKILNKPTIPTKVSELNNDSGFLTEHQDISGKQDTLVSGTNIKTINNQSLLGEGNITILGGTATIVVDSEMSSTSENPVQNKVIYNALEGKVNTVSGKGLSTNDYTTALKNKLATIASSAEVNVQSDWNQTDTNADDYIKNKPTIPVIPTIPDSFNTIQVGFTTILASSSSTTFELAAGDNIILTPNATAHKITISSSGGSGGGGGGDGDKHYTHVQNSASSIWNITHNLGKCPVVTVVDTGGNECLGLIGYIDNNNITLNFSAAFGGTAYLN